MTLIAWILQKSFPKVFSEYASWLYLFGGMLFDLVVLVLLFCHFGV